MERLIGRVRTMAQRWVRPEPADDLRRRVDDLESDVTRLRRELGAAIEYFDRTSRPEAGP